MILARYLHLLPQVHVVCIIDKTLLVLMEVIELGACLTECGSWCSSEFYDRKLLGTIIEQNHPIALKLLNVVVAVKLWADVWAGHSVKICSDNMNTCTVIMRGISIDHLHAVLCK